VTRISVLLLLALALHPSHAGAAPARPDTVVVQDLVVVGDQAPDAAPATVVFQPDALAAVTPWNAGDLEALIPASTITVNSRGESVLMIRGASERHVGITLDGIPLALPWDERADLSLIPLDGVAALRAERGVRTLLSPPNAVAGTVTLETDAPRRGPRTELELRAGTGEDYAVRALHRGRSGPWDVTATVSRRDREALPLPSGATLPYHQADPDRRTNTDLEQTSALLRAERPLGGGGRLALLLTGYDAERGVAPEGHEATGARFWRLPQIRRGLAGISLQKPLGAAWDLDAGAAFDLASQDIRAYPDAGYADTPLQPGDPYEEGRDRTVHLHGKLRRFVGARSSVALGARLRSTRHTVSEVVDGPELAYAQRLASVSLEGDIAGRGPWRLRLGAGVEAAKAPETGEFPVEDARVEPALLARVVRETGRGEVFASVSRRARFPGLRELYSGALGRFEPNPDLGAERQDLAEAGWQGRVGEWDLAVTGFAAELNDGIERVRVDDGLFQRVNQSSIRTKGLELAASTRVGPLEVALHHALLDAEADPGDGGAVRPAEDRADYLGALLVEWRRGAWAAGLTARWVGERWSADSTDEGDGLRELEAQVWGDVWGSREIEVGNGRVVEVRVAVVNVADVGVWEQVGLVGSGRAVVVGGKVRWW